jgi:uncharacterized membrane protein YqhA
MKQFLALTLSLLPSLSQAQTMAEEYPMASEMRENGMIFVVVGVLSIVLTGLFLYLVSVDKKLTKLENEIKE